MHTLRTIQIERFETAQEGDRQVETRDLRSENATVSRESSLQSLEVIRYFVYCIESVWSPKKMRILFFILSEQQTAASSLIPLIHLLILAELILIQTTCQTSGLYLAIKSMYKK